MPLGRKASAAILITALAAAFWAGSEMQKAAYLDQCLDLGGGRNPGNHPICVVEKATAPLQLGPIVITARGVVGGEFRDDPDGQTLVELRLATDVAAALAAFTKASVGGTLDIRVDGNLVRSVNIAEGIEGDRFVIALDRDEAESLAQGLGLDGL
ncbi:MULTISPECIES: hypothetical protein [Aliiruegeria]|uniref:Preprotein translocase subunit SecD n=1 Tax=Aliiruegeria lutimaris TaxID=571298 RepID=A0A1G9KB00_9RHOB|nr:MULTISPECIES: hypothetical protein [Aliiruegeria]NDR58762.1 hypothetical protein [Pseudoruegeria sp. M32A2M]SDL46604.1 hypothetical protein SAMN04488026_10878 [Aliiruegeria lutimaris]